MKKLCIFLLFIIMVSFVQAEEMKSSLELLNNLGAKPLSILAKDGHIVRYDEELNGPIWIPDVDDKDDILLLYKNQKPEVFVEVLYRIPYPDGKSPSESMNEIFSLSHKVSTITGAKYFSRRRQDYAVLFDDVYAVSNLEEKRKIQDPIVDFSINNKIIYLHMKENALGNGYYSINIEKTSNPVFIRLTNETPLKYVLTAAKKHDMVIDLRLYPCTDYILIYGYCGVVLQNDNFVKWAMDPYYSFYRRMTAIKTWLYNNLNKTNELPVTFEPLA